MQYWLAVERLENWLADNEAGHRFLGLSDRKLSTASKVQRGDRILCYVSSQISCFADIRNVVGDAVEPLKANSTSPNYDEPFPYCLRTEPLIVLRRLDWLDIRPIMANLDHFATSKNWRSKLQNSLAKLSERDGQYIEEEMRRRANR